MADIPGQADILNGSPSDHAAIAQAASSGGLPNVVKDNLPALTEQGNRYIDSVKAATDTIHAANQTYLDKINTTSAQQAQPMADALDAVHNLSKIGQSPISNILGIFDSTYSERAQKARLMESTVTLQQLQQQMETASAIRGAVTSTATSDMMGQKEILLGKGLQLDNISKAVGISQQMLQYTQAQRSEQLSGMTPDQIQAGINAGSINPAFGNAELQRKKSLELNLNNLINLNTQSGIQTKAMSQQFGLSQMTTEQLKDPKAQDMLTRLYPGNIIPEELQKRANADASTSKNVDTATEAHMLLRKQTLNDLAGTMTSSQALSAAQDAMAKGSTTLTTSDGRKVTLSPAEAQTLLAQRNEIDTKTASFYGKQEADKVGLGGTVAAGDNIITNLAQLTNNPALVVSDNAARDQVKAHLAQGDVAGGADAATKRLDELNKQVIALANDYKDNEKPAVLTAAKTGQMPQGAAANFLATQAITGNIFKGTAFDALGDSFTNAVKDVADKKAAGIAGWSSGKALTLDSMAGLLADGKLPADQLIREALSKPTGIPDAQGKSVSFQQAYDAQLFSDYVTHIAGTLAKPNSPTEHNPFSGIIDANGKINDMYLRNGQFDPTTFAQTLVAKTRQYQQTGMLSNDQDLSKLFAQALQNPTNVAEFQKSFNGKLTLPTMALHSLLGNNDVRPAISSYINLYAQRASQAKTAIVADEKAAEQRAQSMLTDRQAFAKGTTAQRIQDVNDAFNLPEVNRNLVSPGPGGTYGPNSGILDLLNRNGLLIKP